MRVRERFWIAAALVAIFVLAFFLITDANESAGAGYVAAPPTQTVAAPEPPPDHVRVYHVEAIKMTPPRAVPKPKTVVKHKTVTHTKPKAQKPRAIAVSGTKSQFLICVVKHESHGNYKAENPTSTASGAYQFINASWRSYSKMAGFKLKGLASLHAASAPPAVQDAVAMWIVSQGWYYPWKGTHCGHGT